MVFQKFTHARTDLGEFLFNHATVVGLKKIYRKLSIEISHFCLFEFEFGGEISPFELLILCAR